MRKKNRTERERERVAQRKFYVHKLEEKTRKETKLQ